MISRRQIVGALLGGTALAWPLAVLAQQPAGGVPRIGILDPGIPQLFKEFFTGMRELGYAEGRNVSYVRRDAAGNPERVPQLAKELAELKVDVIVTAGPLSIRSAMQATKTIPIVFAAIGDAIDTGAVKSLARPGGNATGLSFLNTEIATKRLELLRDAFPKLRRVAVLWDVNSTKGQVKTTTDAARALGLEIEVLNVNGADVLESTFAAAQSQHAEALDVLSSNFFDTARARLVELAAKYRLPAMYEHREFAEAGGLMSYGSDLAELFRRAASFVDKILKGAKPGDLPVEQPTRFELVVNLKAAKALDLKFPALFLGRADEVIE